MGTLYYNTVWWICAPPIWAAARRVVIHKERVPTTGGFILASNHLSPYDVPVIMLSSPRMLDFVSIVEMQRKPLVGWFFRNMNCVFVDRKSRENPAAHAMAKKLKAGRAVAMFPEGYIREEKDSVIHGGNIKPGVARLAQLADVPIVPCVVLNSVRYARPSSWIPLRLWKHGLIFGTPIRVATDGADQAVLDATEALKTAYLTLYAELSIELSK